MRWKLSFVYFGVEIDKRELQEPEDETQVFFRKAALYLLHADVSQNNTHKNIQKISKAPKSVAHLNDAPLDIYDDVGE